MIIINKSVSTILYRSTLEDELRVEVVRYKFDKVYNNEMFNL